MLQAGSLKRAWSCLRTKSSSCYATLASSSLSMMIIVCLSFLPISGSSSKNFFLPLDARALFERVITTFPPDTARPLWERWARYEYQYGDLDAAQKLEERIAKVYPAGRFSPSPYVQPIFSPLPIQNPPSNALHSATPTLAQTPSPLATLASLSPGVQARTTAIIREQAGDWDARRHIARCSRVTPHSLRGLLPRLARLRLMRLSNVRLRLISTEGEVVVEEEGEAQTNMDKGTSVHAVPRLVNGGTAPAEVVVVDPVLHVGGPTPLPLHRHRYLPRLHPRGGRVAVCVKAGRLEKRGRLGRGRGNVRFRRRESKSGRGSRGRE